MKISVFGTGYVGLVTGACLANLGHDVLCIDIDEPKISLLKSGIIPFYEPGLKELVNKNQERKKLIFTTDPEIGVNSAEVIFNCVGTPSREDGSADLSYVYKVAETVARYACQEKLLVNKSTVPPGTARRCQEIILRNGNKNVEVISNPEFLAEGKAVYDFTHPEKIVVGAKAHHAYSIMRKVYTGRIRTYIPFLETDWETAEMIKYANNSFLATKVSFINEIANICDLVGADIKIIAQAMGLDSRIGPKFLNAGVGYGGSCFPKDVRALVHAAKEKGYNAELLKEVNSLNERQKKKLVQKIKEKYSSQLSGRTFSIWGLSFKPKTSDVRESPALTMIDELLALGCIVNVYDPIANEEVEKEYGGKINYFHSPEDSVLGSSGILLVTEWDDFRNVDLSRIGQKMKEKIIFDGRNIYEPEIVKEEGFEYFGMGRK